MDVEEGKRSGGGVRLDGRSFESESERSSEDGTGKLNGVRCGMSGLLHPGKTHNTSTQIYSDTQIYLWCVLHEVPGSTNLQYILTKMYTS